MSPFAAQRREEADRPLGAPAGPDHARPGEPRPRVALEHIDQPVETTPRHPDVRVDHRDPRCVHTRKPRVDAGGEAAVRGQANHPGGAEQRIREGGAAVGAGAIHDADVHATTRRGVAQGLEAASQHRGRLVGDDDGRDRAVAALRGGGSRRVGPEKTVWHLSPLHRWARPRCRSAHHQEHPAAPRAARRPARARSGPR